MISKIQTSMLIVWAAIYQIHRGISQHSLEDGKSKYECTMVWSFNLYDHLGSFIVPGDTLWWSRAVFLVRLYNASYNAVMSLGDNIKKEEKCVETSIWVQYKVKVRLDKSNVA